MSADLVTGTGTVLVQGWKGLGSVLTALLWLFVSTASVLIPGDGDDSGFSNGQ